MSGQGAVGGLAQDLGLGDAQANMLNFAAAAGMERFHERVHGTVPMLSQNWNALKYYFEVDNRYVLTKLRTIVFSAVLPNKRWKRVEIDGTTKLDGQEPQYAKKFLTPSLDENAPDLYLPLMSFVTYIIVCSYIKGTNGKFTPEVLTQVMYSCLGFQIFEVMLIRCGLYVLQVQQAPLLDLTANTGYKYVGLCINMVVGMVLGRWVYRIAMLWTGSMTSYFMLKTLANNYAFSSHGVSSQTRMPLLYGFALLQFISIWWLGYGGDLN